MSTWKEKIAQIKVLRDQRQSHDDAVYANKTALNKKASSELQAALKTNATNLERSRKDLHSSIASIYADPHPRSAIENLDDSIPILLLPVRIETRFVTIDNTNELWIRIYPDEIAIHTHEGIMTDQEVEEGVRYWKAVINGDETQKKSAWTLIAGLFGPSRAAWIVRQTKPSSKDGQLIFPKHEFTKTSPWTRAPRINILPDKFVIMLYQGQSIAIEQVGNVIPDELFLGPDPMDADNAFVTKDEKLVFGPSFDWTSDFAKAVDVGMGFKVPLTGDQISRGFDKLLVLGLYLSADETSSQEALETLIDNHHYSPKGFSIVTQGTPTNNTDKDASGYTKNDNIDERYHVETGDPLFDEFDDCDGRNMADALGIEYEFLQYINNSDGTELKEASMMNSVLYPATLGFYFETMMSPVLNKQTQDELRTFFVENVTGRGGISPIRIGNQPYGILLTSDFNKWQWKSEQPEFSNGFLNGLLQVLKSYGEHWRGLFTQLMYVGKPGADPSEVLMNILGLQSGSASFHHRVGYSTEDLKNRDRFKYGGRYYDDMQQNFTSKNSLLTFLSQLGYNERDQNGFLKVPPLLRLVFQHYHTTLDPTNLIDQVPLSETERIRYYDQNAKKNYLHWLAEANSVEMVEHQLFGPGIPKPSALLYLQLRRALLLQLHAASVGWLGNRNVPVEFTRTSPNFHNIRTQPTLTKWEVMKAKIDIIQTTNVNTGISVGDHLLTSGIYETEATFLKEMKDAFSFLADLPTARLERCFAEHLDSCTYRLDAWQSALFNVRLKKLRLPDNENKSRRKGIYIGSYGWVENLRPSPKTRVSEEQLPAKLRPSNHEPVFVYDDNGGFTHAPSINQATAAAVLRSGYLSHAHPGQPGVMAVNLSSQRIRNALFIFQGIRNGQSLETLLGYQFERGLHDRASANPAISRLNLYIYDFRDAFPIKQHAIRQQGNSASIETIPANNVVNGLLLAENSDPFPYGATGAVAAASIEERTAIQQEKDKLADTMDGLKDLLLSESIFHLVQGNFDQSGAVINALKDGNIPPALDVINTPRSSNFSFTNRVTVQFENLDPAMDANNPWAPIPMTPRAIIEPGMNQWIKKIVGEPATLSCRVSHLDDQGNELGFEIVTIDKLQIQPIDLIYALGNELDSSITHYYRRNHSLENDSRIKIEPMKLLAMLSTLKALITDSRHIHAEDFDPPSKTIIADKTNPKGYDSPDIKTRVEFAQTKFQQQLAALRLISIDARVQDSDGVMTDCDNLGEAFDALDAANLNFSDVVPFVFANADALLLQKTLISISLYGLPDSFPKLTTALIDEDKLILLEQGRDVAKRMRAADQIASDLILSANFPEAEKNILIFIEAGKALFGTVFNIIPHFSYNNEADIQQSKNDNNQLLSYGRTVLNMAFPVDEWMQNASHVRPRLARWEYIRSIFELQKDDVLAVTPVQLPYREKDSWIAIQFPESFHIDHDTLSVTVHGSAAFISSSKQSGLLLDDWTELIPVKEEITGISFNYNQPNAMAPQSLLLAIPPVEKGNWNWDDLVGILNNTLLRAKLRAVEPRLLDNLSDPELNVLLPALLANFSEYDLDLALDFRMNVKFYADNIPVQPVPVIQT